MSETETEAGRPEPDLAPPAPAPVPAAKTEPTQLDEGKAALRQLQLALRTAIDVGFTVWKGAEDLPIPDYKHDGDAGMDLRAAFEEAEQTVEPGSQAFWPSNLATIEVPLGFVMDVRSKSGRALKFELVIQNSPGTVDASYRGAVMMIVKNQGSKPVQVRRGEAVAQIVLLPVQLFRLVQKDQLSETTRGAGGFGSTGLI